MPTTATPGSEDDNRKKAQAFFDRGDVIAQTENFEYAIDTYIQGLAFDVDNVDAHKALRDISMRRTAMGGKPLGIFEKRKLPKPTDEKSKLLIAEKLLAHAPGDVDHLRALHEAAQAGGFTQTEAWVEKIISTATP